MFGGIDPTALLKKRRPPSESDSEDKADEEAKGKEKEAAEEKEKEVEEKPKETAVEPPVPKPAAASRPKPRESQYLLRILSWVSIFRYLADIHYRHFLRYYIHYHFQTLKLIWNKLDLINW